MHTAKSFKTLTTLHLKNKRVLVRVDYNVPMDGDGKITDDSRIRSSLSTIKYILESGASCILISHFGRPGGRVIPSLSLNPIAKHLSDLLDQQVALSSADFGGHTKKLADRLRPGELLMLENIRFHPGEEDPENHPEFIDFLFDLADIYIGDAFAALHRNHASTTYLPKRYEIRGAGFLVEKEILVLENLLNQAEEPFYAIIGGAKVSTKIGILESLLDRIDGLIITGAMAFTFLSALGYKVGNSLVDHPHIDTAKNLIKKCKSKSIALHLPDDIIITQTLSDQAETAIVSIKEGIDDGFLGADIGPRTISELQEILQKAKTIFWNGPFGVFELSAFQNGTLSMAEYLADSHAMTIVGGGDTAAAAHLVPKWEKFTHISTGGGATLEFIEKGTLPGLDALK
ncbi:MAG: Bifunctional PGK/TIM [Chlamydiia bacterium]|nr:Bifunctional PGK/TIM [Chlamydiia bacterium]